MCIIKLHFRNFLAHLKQRGTRVSRENLLVAKLATQRSALRFFRHGALTFYDQDVE